MKNYPITISEEQENDFVKYGDAIRMANEAFYDGFITAIMESPEEVAQMDVSDRIVFCLLAKAKSAELTGVEMEPLPPEVLEALQEMSEEPQGSE